jgi:hypothetical protein
MYSSTLVVLALIAGLQASLANSLSAVFGGVNIETPPFSIVSKNDKYEIRRYQPQLWAQAEYTVDPSTDFGDKNSRGFQPLFQYISGKNQREQKIPMTAPVIMQQTAAVSGQRRMAFIMPASLFTRLDQLPQPKDTNVKLLTVDTPLVLACSSFNMGLTSKRVAAREAELRQAAQGDRVELLSGFDAVRVGGYNPPWTLPWFRTNDLCIPLTNQA